MEAVNQKYSTLLKAFGVDVRFVALNDPACPAQEVREDESGFTVHINTARILPELGYESYAAYNARTILLPRLVLETDRLILRRFRDEDAEDCFPFLSDEKGMYLDCCKAFSVMDDAYYERTKLFAERDGQYLITLKNTGEVIGTVNVFEDTSRAVDAMEIGYSISPGHQRKGYAFEALSVLLKLLREDLLLDMVTAGTLEENIPSARLLEKLGFRKEGLRRKAVWHEGLNRPADLQYYYLD